MRLRVKKTLRESEIVRKTLFEWEIEKTYKYALGERERETRIDKT
jgi:hypothetical protein